MAEKNAQELSRLIIEYLESRIFHDPPEPFVLAGRIMRDVGMIEGFIGREYTMETVELGRAPRESGTWSFLRLMQRGSSGEGCCSWEIPVLYTKKKGEEGEQIAAVRVEYAFSPPRGEGSILSPDFWALGSLPESVTD